MRSTCYGCGEPDGYPHLRGCPEYRPAPCAEYREDLKFAVQYERDTGMTIAQGNGIPGDGVCVCGWGRFQHKGERTV